jgi:protoheme IX farnesyltransferase
MISIRTFSKRSIPIINIKTYSDLLKIKVNIVIAFTTISGYILASGVFETKALFIAFFTFLLACGASIINQIQEKDIDITMERTMKRPIPDNTISIKEATSISCLLLLFGLIGLLILSNIQVLILAVIALVWYNLLYTNIKRSSHYAIIIGSFVGALPLVMGWSAAGRELLEPEIIFMSTFLMLWQIPHFWLLTILHYKDYDNSIIPSILDVLSISQVKRICLIWLIFIAILPLFVPFYFSEITLHTYIILLINSVFLILASLNLLNKGKTYKISHIIRITNQFLVITLLIILVDMLLSKNAIIIGI